MNTISTKDKILNTAHRLFSEKGFNGVGIREISKEAEVNIAAINYHFQNKENLYFETIKRSMEETSERISAICRESKSKSPEDMALAIFDFFKASREDLKTNFKLFLSNDQIDSQEEFSMLDSREELIDPPGGSAIYDCLQKAVPNALDEDIIWAVRVLFSQIMHKSIVFCNHCSKRRAFQGIDMEDVFKKELKRLVRVLLSELSSPKHPFEL